MSASLTPAKPLPAAEDWRESALRNEIAADRLLDGISFAEEIGTQTPVVWGRGDQIVWAGREPLMIYGPQGVGKTTMAQRLALARAGIGEMLLGLPVAEADRPVLYVAADRPSQAARSWLRMIDTLTDAQRELVRQRILFWRGPLPFDIGVEPDEFVRLVDRIGAGTLIGDSLKDLAMDLSKEDVAARVNHAWQRLIANGVEVVDLHHPRKSQSGREDKPRNLSDVYGNTWLTAGHGSILLLWGRPGDPIVELSHLKQPVEEVGPLRVIIDHELGMVERHDGGDLLAILRGTPGGLAAKDAACILFSTAHPSEAEVEKARRKLEKYVNGELAFRRPGGRDPAGHHAPVTYLAGAPQSTLEETA